MSGFKDMVAADIHNVFLRSDDFAELRTVKYDGEIYEDIPIVLSGPKEEDRYQLHHEDHIQGLFQVSKVLRCARSDLGGNMPEKGCAIQINTREGGEYFKKYHVASSICELGMLRVELEAIDE